MYLYLFKDHFVFTMMVVVTDYGGPDFRPCPTGIIRVKAVIAFFRQHITPVSFSSY